MEISKKDNNTQMKILALTRYGDRGASSRIRTIQYIPYLKKAGFIIDLQSLLDNEYLEYFYQNKARNYHTILRAYIQRLITLVKAPKYDLLWIEKEVFPMLPAFAERYIAISKKPFVVDYDDSIFHNYDMNRNKAIKIFLKNKIDIIMRLATLVVVGSDYLAERAVSSRAKRVELLPSVIDLNKYEYSDKFNRDVFKIGWIGSPSSSHYLSLIREPLRKFCSKKNAVLVVIGDEGIEFPGVPIEKIRWEEEKESKYLREIDVGIMPLSDGHWEKGKCGYKLIQYMACGRPVVASPVGSNLSIVRNGYNGFWASSEDDWLRSFHRLLESIDLRRRMGFWGRKIVEEKYCLQVTAPKLIEIFRSLL